jgi:hypothetical protein
MVAEITLCVIPRGVLLAVVKGAPHTCKRSGNNGSVPFGEILKQTTLSLDRIIGFTILPAIARTFGFPFKLSDVIVIHFVTCVCWATDTPPPNGFASPAILAVNFGRL